MAKPLRSLTAPFLHQNEEFSLTRIGLESIQGGTDNGHVTKEELIKKLKGLSAGRFAKVAPFIEADIEAADELDALHKEIQVGRQSAATQPILEAKEVYARVRQALAK